MSYECIQVICAKGIKNVIKTVRLYENLAMERKMLENNIFLCYNI